MGRYAARMGGDLRRDRLAAASLQGIVVRHVAGVGDQRDTAEALRAALDADALDAPEVAAAVAELRSRATANGLNMAAAVMYGNPNRARELRLLVLIGADLDEARRLWAEHQAKPTWDPGAWRT